MSWLFVLLAQLKLLAIPFVGRRDRGAAGDWDSPWRPVGVAGLVVAVWRYLTYRYGIGEDALVVRSG